ncbi:hypothetical protein HELRODRAFT_172853 [Helobdella robusta]|uniref:Uncharacterized protein n=1 Tax=Helobdella robusta TaxID=6412 RepID=T1F605_HELRO|nr:hypothetical protein HELRODRAFT_172853 [Helobdella robusta]ESO04466.1 hypothetical protein HELRODRAFT_172853 [Helobdella robusta]
MHHLPSKKLVKVLIRRGISFGGGRLIPNWNANETRKTMIMTRKTMIRMYVRSTPYRPMFGVVMMCSTAAWLVTAISLITFTLVTKGCEKTRSTGLTSEAASNNQCLFWSLRDLIRDSMLIGICCSDSCCFVLVVREPIRLDGPVKTGQGCAKADRLTDRPSENGPLVVRKPIRLDGPVKTGQGCAKADRLTDRPSENRPLVVRKPIRLDGPVKTGQGCAKADQLTDRPSENRPLVVRKPIRLDGPVKTGQGCAKADRLTDRPSENRPWVL